MAVEVSTQHVFRAGIAHSLFTGASIKAAGLGNYDVGPNNQRFVVVQRVDEGDTPTITVVENWVKALEGRE
jgi:hypothetical protein